MDWVDGDVLLWLYPRQKDETPEQQNQFREECLEQVSSGLGVNQSQIFLKERGRQIEGKQYQRLSQKNRTKIVSEKDLKFEVNLSDYLDTGLFLDHRNTRSMVQALSQGKDVLNLFCYTASFTVYAAAGGALRTTSVDLSATYLDWAQRNLALNGFSIGQGHQLVQEDCLSYLQQSKEMFDVIVCDPPTFSNSARMKVSSFDVDRDYPQLIGDCLKHLRPDGILFFSTNSRGFSLDPTKLPSRAMIENLTQKTIPEDFRNRKIHQCFQIRP